MLTASKDPSGRPSMLTTATMPSGTIDIPSAWRGADMAAHPERWVVQLSPSDIAELEQAARAYLAKGKDIGEISKSEFPLPKFGAHLAKLKDALIHGIGFEVIRGLP